MLFLSMFNAVIQYVRLVYLGHTGNNGRVFVFKRIDLLYFDIIQYQL